MELALTGDFITAQRAYEIGLINRVVDAGTVLEQAKELARTIVANGPLAVAMSKKVLVESPTWLADEVFKRQGDLVMPIFFSADAIEGASAFAEKRAPKWQGK
jgi:enoyl-CoA hydratase